MKWRLNKIEMALYQVKDMIFDFVMQKWALRLKPSLFFATYFYEITQSTPFHYPLWRICVIYTQCCWKHMQYNESFFLYISPETKETRNKSLEDLQKKEKKKRNWCPFVHSITISPDILVIIITLMLIDIKVTCVYEWHWFLF